MAKYQALTNISRPQKATGSDPANTRQTDLIRPGETVDMPDAEAAAINSRHRVPVLRPAKEASSPVPGYVTQQGIIGQALFNGTPRAEQFGARPDPAGSSQLIVPQPRPLLSQDGGNILRQPEARDPRPGDEQKMPDAIDIPPRVRAGAGA